jgi:SulP family sulfate permease
MLRIDAGLFFGNAEAVIEQLQSLLIARSAQGKPTSNVVLVMSAVNLIDATALHALRELNRTLRARQIKLHLSEVKGPVMDRLLRSDLIQGELSGQVFLSTDQAFQSLG